MEQTPGVKKKNQVTVEELRCSQRTSKFTLLLSLDTAYAEKFSTRARICSLGQKEDIVNASSTVTGILPAASAQDLFSRSYRVPAVLGASLI